ncbi:MAG: hypothetical protein ACLFTX_07790 [Thiohalospira sp.]
MIQRTPFGGILATGLLAGALLLPTGAAAHGEAGEHVEEFREHMDDYATEVRTLVDRVEAVARDGADEAETEEAVNRLVETWEGAEFHEAVEEVASPLYPPIWQAINGLRDAVDKGAEAAQVRKRADRVIAAFHEGMGGLRLEAADDDGEHDEDHHD